MISQSGNVAVNALGSRRGIGFHTVVSTGNQAVCDASDWLGALSRADGVRSIALFLESDGDGERLAAALADCAERGIGVAVLKVGSSEAGAGAAAAHTGSLAGDQRVFRALIEEAGGRWARDPHELLELARVLAEPRARRDRRRRARDPHLLGRRLRASPPTRPTELGLELPALVAATRERLAELLPEAATIGNPLDYTVADLGRARAARGDRRRGRRRSRDRPDGDLPRHPRGALAGVEPGWRGDPRGARRRRRAARRRRRCSPRPSPT